MDEQSEVLDSGDRVRHRRGVPWPILLVAVAVVGVLAAAASLFGTTASRSADGGPKRQTTAPDDLVEPSRAETTPVVTLSAGTDPRIRIGPVSQEEARLPRLATLLPAMLSLEGAERLSAAPLPRAVALFQRYGAVSDGPVLALGSDGRTRELDVVELRPVTDRDGNRQIALDDTALSPDGRRAAFPQKDEVVIVDLTNATVRRWPLPGFNEIVSWRPDGSTLLVEQESAVFLLGVATGQQVRQPYPGFGTVAGGESGTAIHRLRTLADRGPELTGWDATGVRLRHAEPRPPVGTGEWWGAGWLRGGRIARDVFGAGAPRPYADVIEAEATLVLDAVTGQMQAALIWPGTDRWKGCCQVLGWYDADTVLIASRGTQPRLLAWRIGSYELFQIADLPREAVVALGDLRR